MKSRHYPLALLAALLPVAAMASPPAYRADGSAGRPAAPVHAHFLHQQVRPYAVQTDQAQTLGTFSMLVVPVAYSDRGFGTETAQTDDIQAYLSDMVFGTDSTGEGLYPYPSMRQYYLDQSRGLFVIDGEVADTVTLAQTAGHYATYNNGGSNGCYGLGDYFDSGSSASAQNGGTTKMISEVLDVLDSRGVDLTHYMNGSGDTPVLDGIVFIHVGPGGETASSASDYSGCSNPAGLTTMWSHVLDRDITVGGTEYRTRLLTSAETFLDARNGSRELPSGIGTLAHEFGHVLGLPDLYDTSTSASGFGVGQYSIMGHGLYDTAPIAAEASFGPDFRPKNMDPYLRSTLGWLDTQLLTENLCFESSLATPTDSTVWKVAESDSATEYFLLEARGQSGWDAELPAEGMLVWHIDEAKNGQGSNCIPSPNSNCRFSHYEVAVVQRDGRYGLEARESWMDTGDYFVPGTYLDGLSLPGFSLYAGNPVHAQASVLKVTDAVLYSHLAGDPDSLPPSPDRIGPQPAMQAVVGQLYSWDATVESKGLPVLFTLLDAPEGMTVNTQLGQVRWVPQSVEQVSFTLTAQSCSGSVGRQVYVNVLPSAAYQGDVDGLEIGGCSAARSGSSYPGGSGWLVICLWLLGIFVLRRRVAARA